MDTAGAWIEAYERAWTSNDPAEIGALFTEDARYFTAPSREPWTGREEIVTEWLARKDEPGDWTFRWEPLATDGDLHVVRGWTEYRDDPNYDNLWLIRLAPDGRCSEFVEWFMSDAEDEGS
jgi:nuclear transport factor 2 (NTF2) superfamily protein